MTSPAWRFASWGVLLAAASAGGALLLASPVRREALVWGAFGWLAMTSIGVASGAWLAVHHGSPGHGFLAGLVGGMLARLLAMTIGAVGVVLTGGGGVWGFAVGLTAGFLPMQAYEIAYFYLRGKKLRPPG
jgi:hypothetical protein